MTTPHLRANAFDTRAILERTNAEFTIRSRSHSSHGYDALNIFARVPYSFAAHTANLAAQIVPQGGGKLGRSFSGRAHALARFRAWAGASRDRQRPLIWVHAPSVGEGLMARPLIERLRNDVRDVQIAYTFFSPSAEQFSATVGADVADYLPFDTTAAARGMLDALSPSALVFSKLDVWPLLVAEAAARRVPTALTSATLSLTSSRGSTLASWVLRDAYAALDAVGAIHADDADRLVALGVRRERVSVTGDVRYDQVWNQVSAPQKHAAVVAALRSERPTLVAGSTWPADEAELLRAWPDARSRTSDARIILAAHEPSAAHTARLMRWAEAAGLRSATIDAATRDTDVVIVDRMGMLADLYALAGVAYVGGGFHDKGLHSLVEPAAHGAPVLFGARGTGRDASDLVAAGGAFSVRGASELTEHLNRFFTDRAAAAHSGQLARGVIQAGLGAAARSAGLVERLLAPARG